MEIVKFCERIRVAVRQAWPFQGRKITDHGYAEYGGAPLLAGGVCVTAWLFERQCGRNYSVAAEQPGRGEKSIKSSPDVHQGVKSERSNMGKVAFVFPG